MNFQLSINMGKPDWDKPEEIHTYDITANSWEDAKEQARNALCYNQETFLLALQDELDYNCSLNPDYTEMREVVWALNESAYHRGGPAKLVGTLVLVGGSQIVDVAANYNKQSSILADKKKKALALARIELQQAQKRIKELENQ